MKIVATIFLSVIVLMFTACGGSSGGSSQKSYETQDSVPEVPNPNGTALIVSGNSGPTGISYIEVGENGILVDCGDGGCGDVYAGSEVLESGSTTNGSSESGCPGGNCTRESHE